MYPLIGMSEVKNTFCHEAVLSSDSSRAITLQVSQDRCITYASRKILYETADVFANVPQPRVLTGPKAHCLTAIN